VNLPEIRTWIANQPESSAQIDGHSLHDPNTGAVLTEARSSSHDQVERAIATAHAAHQSGDWWRLGIAGRTPYLLALATELDALGEQIAGLDALNSGVPISITRLFAGSNGDTVRTAIARASAVGDSELLAADHGEVRIHRVPWGVAALILPWNAPAPMAVKKLAFAIATGASVVLKPSPESPFSAQLVMEAVQRAGIPAGVVNLVTGGSAVGGHLVADERIRAIAMTGSTGTGRIIAAAAAPRFARLHLELGSNNAAIIRADADVASAAKAVVDGALKLSGQSKEAVKDYARMFEQYAAGEGELVEADFAAKHSVNQTRMYNVLCWMYGANPEKYGDLVTDGLLPESRAGGCADEYKQLARSWSKLLAPYEKHK